MKNSKNVIIILVLIFTAGMFTKACGDEFLTRPAMGSLSEDVVADRNGVETLLMGAYGALSQTGNQGWGDGLPGDGAWAVCPPTGFMEVLWELKLTKEVMQVTSHK